MDRVLVVAFLAVMLALSDGAAINKREVSDSNSSMTIVKECRSIIPCAWEVYVPMTRRIDFYVKNTCECPRGKSCKKMNDDISIGAYVYLCVPESTSGDPSGEHSQGSR